MDTRVSDPRPFREQAQVQVPARVFLRAAVAAEPVGVAASGAMDLVASAVLVAEPGELVFPLPVSPVSSSSTLAASQI
jgi:hypothetical protein